MTEIEMLSAALASAEADEPDPEPVLAPCPWCGSLPTIFAHNGLEGRYIGRRGWVECCGQGPDVPTGSKAVEHWAAAAAAAWNKRAGEER